MSARGVLFAECILIVLIAIMIALPVAANELRPLNAKRFIAGKWWSYRCFDGTTGIGRALADGSISGTILERGVGPKRVESLPAGTIKVETDSICAPGRRFMGIFTPCFTVDQQDSKKFRGWLNWFRFLYCDFERANPP
jgi:hypothetical protein